MSKSVVLVHGGLWDAMDAEAFWGTTAITGGLTSAGLTVLAPPAVAERLGHRTCSAG
ncbi:hypothetical protein [Kribbella sp. NBC_00359]|uniref:hypothetical protein n=1 Tax=Kribbella sp. NBC_00359 TaxID=2975966 RepID=UPI002E225B8D